MKNTIIFLVSAGLLFWSCSKQATEKAAEKNPFFSDYNTPFETPQFEKIKEELVTTAKELVKDYPKIGAIVLECANMPAYSKFIQEATELPVFDFVTLTNWVYSAIIKK